MEQQMSPVAAVAIGLFNTTLNTLNTLFSLWALTSAAPQLATQSASLKDVVMSSPMLMFGIGLYTLGLRMELGSEIQRKIFKDKPENKGKPYDGGLLGLATNINYGGYTLWRTEYAIAAAGLSWGAAIRASFFYEFTTRAILSLDHYCTERYGDS